jgi:hypothetical protein
LCTICMKKIQILEDSIEMHHDPSTFWMKNKFFCLLFNVSQFSEILNLDPLDVKVKQIICLNSDLALEEIWWNKVYAIYAKVSVTHKKCNQEDGKLIRKVARSNSGKLKKKFPHCIYPFYKKISEFVRKRCRNPYIAGSLYYTFKNKIN